MDDNSILPYVEPIFRFCCKRLGNRYDAEDLSSEIICHILSGMKKYKIDSLEAWVWRIAHNRYARFVNAQNKSRTILAGDDALFDLDDDRLDDLLVDWITTVRKNFEKFVPARLDDQINQWVSIYLHQIIGYVTEELIHRGVLRKPDPEKPLTDGVFYVEGKYIAP